MTRDELLDFEAANRATPNGLKARRIREAFAISPALYYQALNRALDDPAALIARPGLVGSLIRQRDRRREILRKAAPIGGRP